MKNLILTLLSISILSCGSLLTPSSQAVETNDAVETNTPNEKFLGTFEFEIFGLPVAGDSILRVTIERGENGLSSSFDGDGPISEDILVKRLK